MAIRSLVLVVMISWFVVAGAARKASEPDYKNASLPVEQRVADLLGRMTIQEKARQLDMYQGGAFVDKEDGSHSLSDAQFDPDTTEKALGNLGDGSIHDLYPRPAVYNAIQKWVIEHNRLGVPALFIEEGLHGFSNAEQTGTVFPESINLASTWDTELAQETGAGIGSEARASGIGLLLCPVLDVAREPRWGRVEEDFGEDPYLTGELAAGYVHGMQGDSLDTDHTCVAEPKHFAGHGSPESGINAAPVHAGEREMRMTMLRSFEPAFRRSHAMGVMAAYHEVDGVPCTDNPWLLQQVLRKEWGFKGMVITDLGAIHMLYDTHHTAATPEQAVWEALTAGVDMQFYDFPHDVFQNAIINGVRDHNLSMTAVNRAVSDVLRVKFELGLFDHPYVDEGLSARTMRSPEHLASALRSAQESMVLLRNEDSLLPLSKSIGKIAVIGPNAMNAMGGDYLPRIGTDVHQIGLVEGLKQVLGPNADIDTNDGKDIDSAVETARGAKVAILALGENDVISGEGRDRSNLGLPGNQEALLEAVQASGTPVVLVLQNGRPLSIPWAAEHVPAILEAWYAGEKSGFVIAQTLFGDNNPSGKLPVSFPRNVGTLPDFYNHDPSKGDHYVDGSAQPVFPFGFGLSYTNFDFHDLKIQEASPGHYTVTVAITNTGKEDGDEVAELYLRPDTSSVALPVRTLKGFLRVHIAAGATQQVSFQLTPYELEIWGAEKKWVVEPGVYQVFAGGSSEATLTGDFTIPPDARIGAPG